jgi:hypothetical protein
VQPGKSGGPIYDSGDFVNFFRMKGLWLLAVYQWFCLGWAEVACGVRYSSSLTIEKYKWLISLQLFFIEFVRGVRLWVNFG